ncbi:MAG: scyllo-inosose 3-dehydrogenase, partial [Syntrophomonadaceae bacterium]
NDGYRLPVINWKLYRNVLTKIIIREVCKMKGLLFTAEFKPRPGYTPTEREVELQMALSGNKIWYNPKLQLEEKPVPVPKDDEILMKVGACGVCGSDVDFLGQDKDNYLKFASHCKAPTIIGHEYSGEVAAVGKNVTRFKEGDLVVAETMNWCGECEACRMGMMNQCYNLEEIGFTLDGGFAEYLVVKEKYAFNVNSFIEIYGSRERAQEVAALIEPTAVAYHGLLVRSGGFMPGAYVVVTGCGPIGLATVALARIAGAAKVIGIDISYERLEVAKKMGADVVFNPIELNKQGKTVAEAIMEATDRTGVMMHVEASGKLDQTMPEIEKTLAVGAKVAQIGITNVRVSLESIRFQAKDAVYSFSIGSSGHDIWANVIRLVSSGRLDLSPMIAGIYNLDNVFEALEAAKKGSPGKIVVTPHW